MTPIVPDVLSRAKSLTRSSLRVTLSAYPKGDPVPTNPTTPSTSVSVDRLTLGSEVIRGTVPGQASCLACACLPNCFDAEASVNVMAMNCMCFECG